MKKILFALILCPNLLFAQKFDHVWIIGDDNQLVDTTYGGSIIDFNQLPAKAKYHFRDMNMFVANASICDSTGKLLFYSNGCDIAGANDELLPNGTGINPGVWHSILCDQNNDGYASGYPGMIILPKPDSSNLYYFFHQSIKYVSSPVEDAYVDRLLYTVVKKGDGFPKSYIVGEKNIDIIQDSLASGEINAVKHANGKDWWIILPRRNSNQFYVFLFTKNGIVETLKQTIGEMPPADKEGYGQTTFSPDGTKMIRYFPYTPIMFFTFDRNTGHFTNYNTISVNYGSDFASQGGCAISPNSRYLYISALLQVYQFDLWASDISTSQVKVAVWDGFINPVAITFLTCQLGPDCKIYILGGGDTRYYHIIHNPDEPGLACNFEQRGLVLPTPSGASIPYFPNYRLGPLDNPGLPCSAVVSTNTPPHISAEGIRVFPNPAMDQVTFVWEPESAPKALTIRNAYGQIVQQTVTTSVNQTYTWSIESLTSGMYFWEVSTPSGVRLGTGKVMKL